MQPKQLFLTIRNREQLIYKGEVKSLTSFNDKGTFDILPSHANFISLINDKVIIREIGGGKKEIKIDNAVMRVLGSQVNIFLGIRGSI